jgi:hypothetical protein
MYVIRKNGFYLWSFNPYADLWIESKAKAKIMSKTIAHQCVTHLGGEIIAAG